LIYARRTDGNHTAIRTAFRKLLGDDNVVDTSRCGGGLGDLVITYGGQILMIEIKDGAKPPSRRKLTKAQKKSTLPTKLVNDMDDVAQAVATLKGWSHCLATHYRGAE